MAQSPQCHRRKNYKFQNISMISPDSDHCSIIRVARRIIGFIFAVLVALPLQHVACKKKNLSLCNPRGTASISDGWEHRGVLCLDQRHRCG